MDPDAIDELCSAGSTGSGEQRERENSRETVPSPTVVRPHHGGAGDRRLLDFSVNVNPKRPPSVVRVYESALATARSYPVDDYSEFRVAAAEYVGCEPRQVIPTPGGLAAIRLAVATTITEGDQALIPYPSFGEYAREVRLQGGEPVFVHHENVFDVDPGEFSLVVLCTPNNPTGTAYSPERLRTYAEKCRAVGTPLLVDEAFLGFTELPSLAGSDGVIVVRSLTKLFGLPGLRAGFAVATGTHRERLDASRLTWGLGTPAAAVGQHCLEQHEFVDETRDRVRRERARMRRRLAERFDVYPSEAPFLLMALEDCSVDAVVATLRERRIYVRDARSFRGLDNHIRVAVLLPEQNDRLLDALDV